MYAETKPFDQTKSIKADDPAMWLDEHGDYLFRFALSRVRNHESAEDLVQETLLAAVQNIAKFGGSSSVRTWLTAILKHKVVDHFRRRAAAFQESTEWESEYFGEDGHWLEHAAPIKLRSPEEILSEREFCESLEECITRMPPHLAAVFSMREIEGLDRAVICEMLAITPSNYWVMLHRARLYLRREFEKKRLVPDVVPFPHSTAVVASA
jgi:RNA polymerase sigma-70 factor, ECF subfamily